MYKFMQHSAICNIYCPTGDGLNEVQGIQIMQLHAVEKRRWKFFYIYQYRNSPKHIKWKSRCRKLYITLHLQMLRECIKRFAYTCIKNLYKTILETNNIAYCLWGGQPGYWRTKVEKRYSTVNFCIIFQFKPC